MLEMVVRVQDVVDNLLILAAKGLRKLANLLGRFSNSLVSLARRLLLHLAGETEERVARPEPGLVGAVRLSFLRNHATE